jgi:hypothetical protein
VKIYNWLLSKYQHYGHIWQPIGAFHYICSGSQLMEELSNDIELCWSILDRDTNMQCVTSVLRTPGWYLFPLQDREYYKQTLFNIYGESPAMEEVD